MTQHNSDDENHPLEPLYNAKDHIEEIIKLPEFKQAYEAFLDELPPLFGDETMVKRYRRINRFLQLANPFIYCDEDTYIKDQQTLEQTSSSLTNLVQRLHREKTAAKPVTASSSRSVKAAALKKTIKELEDRISEMRRQLGEQ